MRPRIPRRLLLELTMSMLRGEHRSSLLDSRRMLASVPHQITGIEHVPPSGGYTIVANHYQRWDLWIGWEGALLMEAIGRPIHWLVLPSLKGVPFSRSLFRRVARTYDFIPAQGPAAVRTALRLLADGDVIGLFPEGPQGHARGLSPALPTAAKLAVALAHRAPLVPAAVRELNGTMVAKLGPAYRPVSSEQLMQPILALLIP